MQSNEPVQLPIPSLNGHSLALLAIYFLVTCFAEQIARRTTGRFLRVSNTALFMVKLITYALQLSVYKHLLALPVNAPPLWPARPLEDIPTVDHSQVVTLSPISYWSLLPPASAVQVIESVPSFCLLVCALTAEPFEIPTRNVVWASSWSISRMSSMIKVIGQRSKSLDKNRILSTFLWHYD